MEAQTNENNYAKRQRTIRWIAGWFIGLLCMLTLLSNTLLALTLPKAVTAAASKSPIVRTFKGTAVIRPVEETDLMRPTSWKTMKVFVEKGAQVQKGQVLVTYDNSEAGQQLEEETAALAKLKLSSEQLELDYIQAQQNGDSAAISSAKMALEAAKIDMSLQEKRIQNQQSKMESSRELVAPFDGAVKEIYAKEGMSQAAGAPDIRLTNTKQGFQFQVDIPDGIAAMLNEGEPVSAKLLGKESRMLQGVVDRLEAGTGSDATDSTDTESRNRAGTTTRVFVKLEETAFQGGERVEVSLVKTGGEAAISIPKAAVRQDSTGSYVYTIEERKSPLGNAYYVVRRAISVGDSNDYLVSVGSSLFDGEQVIVESSVPLQAGDRVRL